MRAHAGLALWNDQVNTPHPQQSCHPSLKPQDKSQLIHGDERARRSGDLNVGIRPPRILLDPAGHPPHLAEERSGINGECQPQNHPENSEESSWHSLRVHHPLPTFSRPRY